MTDSYYAASSAHSDASAPPPPPKPYSQDPSRNGTPTTSSISQQTRYTQQYPQPPLPPQHQSYNASPSQQHQGSVPGQYPTRSRSSIDQSVAPTSYLPQTFDLPESITKQTTPDLSKLLADSSLISAIAQSHSAYATALQPLQSQISQNITMASQVASLEAQVKALREQTGQLLVQHGGLQTQWSRKQTEMDQALAPWGPRAMYQRLLAGINEQENMLMAVQESFLDSSSDTGHVASEKELSDWIKRIREGTIVLEKRREMRARWDEGRVGGWR